MSTENQKFQNPFIFFYVLLVSAGIVILWLIPLLVRFLQGEGTGTGFWELFTISALFFTILAPIVYGWFTKDTKGAVIIGVLPFLFTMTIPRVVAGELPRDTPLLIEAVLYIVSLCVIGGLEGYFASRREWKSLVIAAVLAGVWIFVFISGIH